MNDIFNDAKKIQDEVIEHRRYLHANPELSYQEYNTCKYICTRLEALGIEHKIIAKTGVVAVIHGKSDDCIALRADIDALPIKEETELDFASKNDGIMHACGHDFHTAMLLGAAKLINIHKSKLHKTVKFIFQPAEEVLPGGAFEMIQSGALKNPTPSMIFAQHIDPTKKCGTIHIPRSAAMASTNELFFTINGKGAHAAQPHLGNDPIIAAASIINYLHILNTKHRNPMYPAVISICSINGGNATNIFPDEVQMKGTMRTFDKKLRSGLMELIYNKCNELAGIYDTQCKVEIVSGYPAVINDKNAVNIAWNAAINLFGKDSVFEAEPKMLAEDFAYYSEQIPACFWHLGTAHDDGKYPASLHNAKLNPCEDALIYGAALMAYIALTL